MLILILWIMWKVFLLINFLYFYLENDIEGAITYLYKEASKRWIMEEEVIDDITIILVFLN